METNREETKRVRPKLEEARRRWGKAEVLEGESKPFTPAPAATAAAADVRRAA